MNTSDLAVGCRVSSNRAIDIYPLGVWPVGTTGTVTQIETVSGQQVASVRLDEHFSSLGEWDNCLMVWERSDEANSDATLAAFDLIVGPIATLAYEFPDYPASDVPADLPSWLVPSHWHNDTCPSWCYRGPLGIVSLYIDYADPSRREFVASDARYILIAHDADWADIGHYATDSWPDALATLLALRWVCGHGLSLHPDTPGTDYVLDKTGERALSDAQASVYEAHLESITSLEGDVYQAIRNAFFAMGLMTEAERKGGAA